jgi:hypothetical protein
MARLGHWSGRHGRMPANLRYWQQVKRTGPILCIPEWDTSGSVAEDISGNGLNGTYNGPDLAIEPLFGRHSPYFDGASDYVNIFSAGLAARFNGQLGTAMIWGKLYDASVLTDGANHTLLSLYTNANNRITINKTGVANQYTVYRAAGGVYSQRYFTSTSTTFNNLMITWDKTADQVCVYFNNTLQGAVLTGLGDWSGSLTQALVGKLADNTYLWYGYTGFPVVWDRVLTAGERSIIATANP